MGENSFLPFLPGYSFTDPTKTRYAVSQTLHYNKGCRIPKTLMPTTTLQALELMDAENKLWDNSLVELTYGPKKATFQKLVEPEAVAFDKKVLRFYAYMKEDVFDLPSEKYRIRPMKIYYYLEDDTMEITEPKIENCGLPQGVLIKKHKFPRSDGKGFWNWKDLNLGMDFQVYGKKLHIADCDQWTKEYYLSAGIILNGAEYIPADPHAEKVKAAIIQPQHLTPNIEDEKRHKFLNYDRHVLRFYGLWDDTLNLPSEMRKVIIQFYLADDTLEILEVHAPNNGRDPYPVFLRRQKVPINRKDVPQLWKFEHLTIAMLDKRIYFEVHETEIPTFPLTVMEITEKEIKDWYTPRDLQIGKTILVYNKKILLYDCDEYTKYYYREKFNVQDFTPIDLEVKPPPPVPMCVPPHSGIGTWEDSLQSCFSLRPKPLKKDVIKFLQFDDQFLRYEAVMDTVWPIDKTRRFIITFFPGDDTIAIYEPFVMNSGMPSGQFMKRCRLVKARGPGDKPQYYEGQDLYIGAVINAYERRFIITGADNYVLKFMEENRHAYPEAVIEKQRQGMVPTKLEREPLRSEKEKLIEEIRSQVQSRCGKENVALPDLQLGNDLHPLEEVKNKLYSANLPVDESLLQKAVTLCTAENGDIDVDELYKILSISFGCIKKE